MMRVCEDVSRRKHEWLKYVIFIKGLITRQGRNSNFEFRISNFLLHSPFQWN